MVKTFDLALCTSASPCRRQGALGHVVKMLRTLDRFDLAGGRRGEVHVMRRQVRRYPHGAATDGGQLVGGGEIVLPRVGRADQRQHGALG